MMDFSEIILFVSNIQFIMYVWFNVFYNHCVEHIKNAIAYVCFGNNWITYSLLFIVYGIYDMMVFTHKMLKFISQCQYGDLDEFIE